MPKQISGSKKEMITGNETKIACKSDAVLHWLCRKLIILGKDAWQK